MQQKLTPCQLALTSSMLFGNRFGHSRTVYQWTMGFTLASAVLELCRVAGLEAVAGLAARFLPLYAYGLGWVVPAAVGFAIGMAVKNQKGA